MTDYSDRQIESVDLGALVPSTDSDGQWIVTNMSICLTGPTASTSGPRISVEIGFPVTDDMTIKQIREVAFERACDALGRVTKESAEHLRTLVTKATDATYFDKK